MNILEKFKAQSFYPRLGRRGPNFALMVQHVLEIEGRSTILETGCAWDKDNYEGQGQSTLLWDWLAGEMVGLNVVSIDITEASVKSAKEQTTRVNYILGNSIIELSKFEDPEDIALLYLDAYDWTPEMNLESAAHHLMELTGIFARLRPGTMVVVDDRHGEFKGKHWMVEEYFKQLKVKPVFKNYQIGWILP